MPDDGVIEQHARRLIKNAIARDTLAAMVEEIDAEAATAELPADLADDVQIILQQHPAMSWDAALASILG